MAIDDKLERAADLGADALIACFTYQGDNPKYFKLGKLGLGACANFVKKFSANNNAEALRVEAEKARKNRNK